MFPRSSICDQTGQNYTAPDGLNFTTYCGQDVVSSSTYSSFVPTEKNFTECMDDCSTADWRCWGVMWQESNSSCWELSNPTSLSATNLTASDTRDIALGNTKQLAIANVSCPYTDGTSLTTPENMEFQVSCNMEIEGNDLCPWFSDFCPTYAETLEECMEACVHAHPLCKAAMWNPGHLAGYLNCFLKNATGPLVESTGSIYHTAVANIVPLAEGCPTYTNYTSSDGKVFDITCSQQITQATNLTIGHHKSITDCIDACANHDSPIECEAIVYDATMGLGFENCYLFNSVQMLDSSTYLNVAQLVTTSTNSTNSTSSSPSASSTSSTSSTSSSSSKAWIAGPVTGGVVAIVGIVLAWFWWNRRKTRNEAPTQELPSQDLPPQEGKKLDASDIQQNYNTTVAPETKPYHGELGSAPLSELMASQRVELPSEGNTTHEMPA